MSVVKKEYKVHYKKSINRNELYSNNKPKEDKIKFLITRERMKIFLYKINK